MTRPQNTLPAHDDAGAGRGRITGLDGYEAALDYHLWFRSYPQRPARAGGPTHSVHIARPGTEPGCFTLAELWQGPLPKLIRDAVTQGYLRKAAEVEPVGQLELFAGVGA